MEKGSLEDRKYRNLFLEAGYSQAEIDAKLTPLFRCDTGLTPTDYFGRSMFKIHLKMLKVGGLMLLLKDVKWNYSIKRIMKNMLPMLPIDAASHY